MNRAKREGKSVEEALQDYAKPIPLGRYITSAVIPVDGGRLNSIF